MISYIIIDIDIYIYIPPYITKINVFKPPSQGSNSNESPLVEGRWSPRGRPSWSRWRKGSWSVAVDFTGWWDGLIIVSYQETNGDLTGKNGDLVEFNGD